MKDIEARLEIGMVATVEAARVEKDAWKKQRDFLEFESVAHKDEPAVLSQIKELRQSAEERYCEWQREEELRRKALKAWREHNEG